MEQKPELSHLNSAGELQMVDISHKPSTIRQAIAAAEIKMKPATLAKIMAGDTPKGDIINTAKVAGIMAAKQTSDLIPLCHPLPLHNIEIDVIADPNLPGYQLQGTVKTKAETGVEMEALTAVSVAALTLYDMAKALEKSMVIQNIRLLAKTGGKSADYQA
ncbi:MAG: cyclic pyranopterin monophosphate synthase MoaC [Cyanobacteria bacterium J083]|nr:MAG: cyclic pyranopterin monophosphate synthase MoaC [Cyanobacteria bacterium J083]